MTAGLVGRGGAILRLSSGIWSLFSSDPSISTLNDVALWGTQRWGCRRVEWSYPAVGRQFLGAADDGWCAVRCRCDGQPIGWRLAGSLSTLARLNGSSVTIVPSPVATIYGAIALGGLNDGWAAGSGTETDLTLYA